MKLINRDKPERHYVAVKNAQTYSIAKGRPVVLEMNGTDDGLAVEYPSGAVTAAAADNLFLGVAAKDIPAYTDVSLVQVFGLTPEAVKIRIQTRAATTDNVATAIAIAVGAPMVLDTVNNCFSAAASVAAATAYAVKAIAGGTHAGVSATIAGTDIASSGDNSAWYGVTALTSTMKVFLRNM